MTPTASTYRIEVWPRQRDTRRDTTARLYFLAGDLTPQDVQRLTDALLVDDVTERAVIGVAPLKHAHSIDVSYHPGVTDPAAENLLRAAHTMGFAGLRHAATGQRHALAEAHSADELHALATKVFSNPVVQRFSLDAPIAPPFIEPDASDGYVACIALREADDAELLRISQERRLALDAREMRAIQAYYRREERDPTDVELEMLAQTWSEHCVHKTFKANIAFTDADTGAQATINGLLKTFIRAATDHINKPWVRSAFVDNAGIIAFDDDFDLAFKVETHNRPSALDPFGGANTGVGGVVRDILGVSAKPIANTDVLCFGPPDWPAERLPAGVLAPQRIAEGVIDGIEDYGNKMGIPTVNGAIVYDRGYLANPLVFCGCLGWLPRDSHPTEPQAGDQIIVIGGRTGRDGLRGATFSSMGMDAQTADIASVSVQIGHPINEKQVQELVLRARDAKLYHAITDCGAGGLSSAVGEMGAEIGAHVQLERVPLKYPGLRPWEVWLSEAQERMVLAVAPEAWPRLQALAEAHEVEAVSIGHFEASGRLQLYDGERLVGDVSMDFLHEGLPTRNLTAVWRTPAASASAPPELPPRETLLALLADPDIRSKEDVIRRYDHEVQSGTVVKPLVGVNEAGPGDGAVLIPIATRHQGQPRRGVALSNGLAPHIGQRDPYAMAHAAVDEALRNLVALGADPDQIAILDNFCWGDAQRPETLGALVRAAQGCHDAALTYQTPFISGKDSLNNEYSDADGTRHAIPGTLVISALGIVPDTAKTITSDFKRAGNALYLIGETRAELGQSHAYRLHDYAGGTVPQPNENALTTLRAVYQAIQTGNIAACHDLSEGGLAVTLAEMVIGGGLGADIILPDALAPESALFSQSLTRFVVEVSDEDAFLAALGDAVPVTRLGVVSAEPILTIQAADTVTFTRDELVRAWRGHLPEHASSVVRPALPESVKQASTRRRSAPSPSSPRALILHARGTNRDHDAALACELAGAQPEIVTVKQLTAGERSLLDYHLLLLPGGFSYGDDLGAGVLWAQDLRLRLGDALTRFIDEGRPVMGICNGFQGLVKSGLLPGDSDERPVTLTHNASGRFECRWTYLYPNPQSPSLFTEGISEPLYVPVAHGEGRLVARDDAALESLWSAGLAALFYVNAQGEPAAYPDNPNGSVDGIAGLSNAAGNVFGLMPHPENHLFPWQHPRYHRGEAAPQTLGLRLFENAVRHA